MPAAIPAVIAGAIAATSVTAPLLTITAAGAFTGGLSFAFSWGTFALVTAGSLALGQLSKMLAPKPPKASSSTFSNEAASQSINVREPITSHKIVYGQTRVGGKIAFMGTSGTNEYLHIVILMAAHEIESIDEVWVDDYVIPNDALDVDGNVISGRYKDYMRIRKHLGSPTQVADPLLVAAVPQWNNNCRLQEIAYLYVMMKFNSDLYPSGVPNFSSIIKGKKVLDPRTDVTRWHPNVPLFWRDYMTSTAYGVGTDAADIEPTNIIAASNTADDIVDTEFLEVNFTSVDTATNIITTVGNRLQYQLGDRVVLLTTGTLPSGLATATDYYVIPYQFKETPRLYLATSLDNAIAGTAIDITTSGSGTHTIRRTGEPRYHGAGVIDTANTIQDNIEDLLTGAAARAIFAGGQWRLNVATWVAPTLELTESDFVGAMQLSTRISRRDRANTVKGTYLSSINDFQPTDYPPQIVASYIAEDGDIQIAREYDMPFTNRSTTAQRITRIQLQRMRQEMSFKVKCTMKAFQCQAGDVVMITSQRLGWTQKYFEVVNFKLAADGGDSPRLVVELEVRETAEEVFDWTSSDATERDPAPNTELPNPFLVIAPDGVSYNSRIVNTAASDQLYNLSLQWNEHDDAFVRQNGKFEIRFKQTSETDWRPSFYVDGSGTFADILQISVNVPYDLGIRAINNIGVKSNWVTLLGAVAGSSGGVTVTDDYGEWVSSPSSSEDFGDFVSAPSSTDDYGYFT
jgi:hypothetical protein